METPKKSDRSYEHFSAAKCGPHGLGDPKDMKLRKIEANVIIPKRLRQRIQDNYCTEEMDAFRECGKEASYMIVNRCQEDVRQLKLCIAQYFYNEELREQVTQDYLKERSDFRSTGIPAHKIKLQPDNK